MNFVDLSPVRRLVSRIEADIAADAVAPGAVLGTESELCARYGVSTTIFRQAARILEAADLAVTRRGNGGGLVVNGHSVVGAARTVATYLDFRGASVADVLPVSARMFHLGVRLAAERITLADVDRLRALHAEIPNAADDFERGMRNLELNQQIVAAAGNPVLELLYCAAQHFYTHTVSFHRGMEEGFLLAEARAAELLEALVACDKDRLPALTQRAVAMNRRHMEASAHRKPPIVDPDAPLESSPGRTLSDQVAHRMLQEIIRLGWPVGRRLGSEPELMIRYGVSRATFRQAVRQLEQHFAVCSRRGPGGGIFVQAPVEERVLGVAGEALRLAPVGWADVQGVAPDLVGLALDACLHAPEQRSALVRGLRLAARESEPDRTLDLVRQALARNCGNTAFAHLLELVACLGERSPECAGDDVGDLVPALVGQAVDDLARGDDARAKRSLLELTRRFGVTGQVPVPGLAQRDEALAP